MGITKTLFKFAIFVVLIVSFKQSAFSQALQPQPPLELLNSGWGAAANGMGGAYAGVAEDMTAIYWNPAGLAQLPGLQIYGEYALTGDTDEDFAAELFPDDFQSIQRFSGDGNQFDFVGVSYEFTSGATRVVPAFAWHKNTANPPKRELKEPAGVVDFLTSNSFVQSEGTFTQEFKGAGEEYSIGVGASVNNRIMIGGTVNFAGGTPKTILTGQFHDTFDVILGPPTVRTDINLDQTLSEDVSGTSFRVGFLFAPVPAIKVGTTLRFPYTRTSQLTLERTGTRTLDGSLQNFNETATAESEVEIPIEWTVGASVFIKGGFRASGAVTYADWEDVEQVTRESSNPLLIANTVLPYPALRANAFPQHSLLQWRGGIEYFMGRPGEGLVIRSGYFLDGQPYGDRDSDRAEFNGYSFGVGYIASGFGLEAAFVREKADFVLTSASRNEESSFSFRRFLISVSWISF